MPKHQGISAVFERVSQSVTQATGSTSGFIFALSIILLWGVTGPLFGFSDTWQLVINTGTTIVTFLMVFLIQRSQNKESLAVQVKLDELLLVLPRANNRLIDAEDLDEKELEALHRHYQHLADLAAERRSKRSTHAHRGRMQHRRRHKPDAAH